MLNFGQKLDDRQTDGQTDGQTHKATPRARLPSLKKLMQENLIQQYFLFQCNPHQSSRGSLPSISAATAGIAATPLAITTRQQQYRDQP